MMLVLLGGQETYTARENTLHEEGSGGVGGHFPPLHILVVEEAESLGGEGIRKGIDSLKGGNSCSQTT